MNRAPTALIAEDEPLLAAALRADLGRLWPELQVVAVAGDGQQAVEQALALRPTICFLDIRMPGLSGLEAARALAEDWPDGPHFPLLVFVTAYDQYALQAFEAGAVDYLLKPVEADRLAATCERVRRKLAQPPADATALLAQLRAALPASAPQRLRWIKAAIGKQVKLIAVNDVVYFQSDTKYTRVVLAGSEALIRTPLKDLVAELDPERFWQVHRSTVVNTEAIAGVLREDAEKQFVLLKNRPERLAVSRQFTHLFKQM
jgi:DNA-binding LytR/AlgR family response regulator